jgi:hypothetical protein
MSGNRRCLMFGYPLQRRLYKAGPISCDIIDWVFSACLPELDPELAPCVVEVGAGRSGNRSGERSAKTNRCSGSTNPLDKHQELNVKRSLDGVP